MGFSGFSPFGWESRKGIRRKCGTSPVLGVSRLLGDLTRNRSRAARRERELMHRRNSTLQLIPNICAVCCCNVAGVPRVTQTITPAESHRSRLWDVPSWSSKIRLPHPQDLRLVRSAIFTAYLRQSWYHVSSLAASASAHRSCCVTGPARNASLQLFAFPLSALLL